MKLKVKEKEEEKWYKDPYAYAIIVMIFMLIYVVVLVLNFTILSETKRTVRNAQTVNQITSLNSSNEMSGRFYLGYGSFGETEYYVYMQKDEKFGGFTKEKVPASETLLVEKNTNPNIVMNYSIVENVEKRPFFDKESKSADSLEYGAFTPIPSSVKYKYIITVPVGTVTEHLTFDPTK